MNDPIMLTPGDIVSIILAVCGAIITISGAIAVITNFVNKAKSPNKKQDERLDSLEDEVKKINDRLEKGDKQFDLDAERVARLENSVRQTNKIIIESLQALTAHAIDGNNIEELQQSKKRLDDYLLNKI